MLFRSVYISKMKNICLLNMRGNDNISYSGLRHLKKLPYLRVIDISKTRVSEIAIKKLRDSMPYCIIEDYECYSEDYEFYIWWEDYFWIILSILVLSIVVILFYLFKKYWKYKFLK